MLFQGQEFGSSAPFMYFSDHREDLRLSIRKGRREFLRQFASTHDHDVQAAMPDPDDESVFERCRLDFSERETNAPAYSLHRDLLRIRRTDDVLAGKYRIDGAVLTPEAFLIRYMGNGGSDRLLIVNLGSDVDVAPVPEPLLAPPRGARWHLQWSSEAVAYGGSGRAPLHPHPSWHLPGETAVLLRPGPLDDAEDKDGDEHDH